MNNKRAQQIMEIFTDNTNPGNKVTMGAEAIFEKNGAIKQVDDCNFIVQGKTDDYEVCIDEENETLACGCAGWKHYKYCKHSYALAMWIGRGKYDDSMFPSKKVKKEDLKMESEAVMYNISEADKEKYANIQKKLEAKQQTVVLKKTIPTLEINYDMFLPIPFGGYMEMNGELDTISRAINSSLPFLIEGDKGIGKTLAVNTVCVKENIPEVSYSCSSGTTMGDILGKEHILGNDSVFELGLLPTAIQVANHFGKGILYLDELNALEPEIQKMLNPVIDARRCITVNGNTYRLKEGVKFNIVATMNPSTYAGTSPLNEDLRSRFIGEVWKYPSANQLSKIINWDGIDEDKVQVPLLQLAMDTLGMKQKGTLEYVLSTRDIDLFTRAYRAFSDKKKPIKETLAKAINTSILIKFGDAEDRETMRLRAEETFGVSLPRE